MGLGGLTCLTNTSRIVTMNRHCAKHELVNKIDTAPALIDRKGKQKYGSFF